MFDKHPDGRITKKQKFRDVDFLNNDFSSMGKTRKDLKRYELEEMSRQVILSTCNEYF